MSENDGSNGGDNHEDAELFAHLRSLWRSVDPMPASLIDRMIADERRESMALQKIIFPTVALFVSTLVIGILKPQIFANSAIIGKIILISLFIAGVIHLIGRLRDAMEKYTYNEDDLHDSILDDNEPEIKPYSRLVAGAFLFAGVVISLGAGVVIGNFLHLGADTSLWIVSNDLQPEAVFYPPIFILFVDLVHAFASRFDQ
jgi:hypothetical protein